MGDAARVKAPEGATVDRPDRQVGDPRPRDGPRAPLLPDRPRRLRAAGRELHPALPRGRRDDDEDRRERERLHGPEAEAADRGGPAAGARDRRDRAVPERPEHVPADARHEGRRRSAQARGLLGRHGRDVVQGLHADQPRAARRGGRGGAQARAEDHRPPLLGHLRGGRRSRHRQSRARLPRRRRTSSPTSSRIRAPARGAGSGRSRRSTRTASRSRRW